MMMEKITRFLDDETAQGLMEYGMVLILVSVAAIAALSSLGTSIDDLMRRVIPLPGGS